LRFQQRLLQRFGQINVGLRSARANCNTETNERDIGGRAGHQLRLRGGVLEHLARNDGKVDGSPLVANLISSGVVPKRKDKLVAGGALELCAELF
jgi:hypothetical protein